MSANPESNIYESQYEADLALFQLFIKNCSKENQRKVLNSVKRIYEGKGIQDKDGRSFPPFINKRITFDNITEDTIKQARNWAPHKTHDKSNGWLLTHFLRKMLNFKLSMMNANGVIPRTKTKSKNKGKGKGKGKNNNKSELNEFSELNIKSLSTPTTWTVNAHRAQNRERINATIPFLNACLSISKIADDWCFKEEYSFETNHKCDLYLESKDKTKHAVVECKSKNLLHGIGQVLHYERLAKNMKKNHENSEKEINMFMLIVLPALPNSHELDTAKSMGIHVWWPGEEIPL